MRINFQFREFNNSDSHTHIAFSCLRPNAQNFNNKSENLLHITQAGRKFLPRQMEICLQCCSRQLLQLHLGLAFRAHITSPR